MELSKDKKKSIIKEFRSFFDNRLHSFSESWKGVQSDFKCWIENHRVFQNDKDIPLNLYNSSNLEIAKGITTKIIAVNTEYLKLVASNPELFSKALQHFHYMPAFYTLEKGHQEEIEEIAKKAKLGKESIFNFGKSKRFRDRPTTVYLLRVIQDIVFFRISLNLGEDQKHIPPKDLLSLVQSLPDSLAQTEKRHLWNVVREWILWKTKDQPENDPSLTHLLPVQEGKYDLKGSGDYGRKGRTIDSLKKAFDDLLND